MKVMFLAPYMFDSEYDEFKKNKTGFGMMVKSISESLSAKGISVFILTHAFTTEKRKNNLLIIQHLLSDVLLHFSVKGFIDSLSFAFRRELSFVEKLKCLYYFIDEGYVRKAIKKYKPDIVHIHGLGLGTKPYIDVCERNHIPYVVTIHGLIENASEALIISRNLEATYLRSFNSSGKIFSVISSGMKKRLCIESHYGLNRPDDIIVIPNGIDTEPGIITESVRKKYNIPEDGKICISVGSVCEGKNQIQLITAFDLLDIRIKNNLWLIIIGSIAPDYPIVEAMNKSKWKDHIILTGFVDHKELCNYYSAADVNIMVSKEEGFGLSLVEGLVYGTPCIAFSDLDAVPDIYDPAYMVLCYERRDAALAEAITTCLSTKWNRNEIAIKSKKFSKTSMTDRYVNLYYDVLDTSK